MRTDLDHLNEIIDGVMRGVRVDTSKDIRSGANSKGSTVYIDRRIPRYDQNLLTSAGRPFDIHSALAVHEMVEEKAMAGGMGYDRAHEKLATPAERHFVEQHGVNWKRYSDVMDGYLDETEHEKAHNVPKGLHVDPEQSIGHHRGKADDDSATSNELGAGLDPGTGSPALADAARNVLGGPSWLERAAEQMRADRAAYGRGGVHEMLRDLSGTQELSQGFGGGGIAGATRAAGPAAIMRNLLTMSAPSKFTSAKFGTSAPVGTSVESALAKTALGGDVPLPKFYGTAAPNPIGQARTGADPVNVLQAYKAQGAEDVPNVVTSAHIADDPNYPGGVIQMPSGDFATASHVHNINDPYYWKAHGPGGQGLPSAEHNMLPDLPEGHPAKSAPAKYKLVPTADFDPAQQDYFVHSPSGEKVGELTHNAARHDEGADYWHLSVPKMGYTQDVKSPNAGLRIAQEFYENEQPLPQSKLTLPKPSPQGQTFTDLGKFPREMPFGVPPQANALGFETPGLHATRQPESRWDLPLERPTPASEFGGLGAAHAAGADALKLPENELGVHFGNPRQAQRFAGNEVGPWNLPRTYPAVLRTGNQLELPDLGNWGFGNMRTALRDINEGTLTGFNEGLKRHDVPISREHKGLFPNEELRELKGIPDVREYLASKGFDSIKYVNSVEDPGAWSHIMFKPSPVAKDFVAGVRSPFAKFEAHKLGYPELAAGIGAGMIAPGLFIDEDGKPLVRTK